MKSKDPPEVRAHKIAMECLRLREIVQKLAIENRTLKKMMGIPEDFYMPEKVTMSCSTYRKEDGHKTLNEALQTGERNPTGSTLPSEQGQG